MFSYRHYSQRHVRFDKKRESRLDLTLISPDFLHNLKSIRYVDVCRDILDHCAQYIDLQGKSFEKSVDPPFKAPNCLLRDHEYVDFMTNGLRETGMENLAVDKCNPDYAKLKPETFYNKKFETSFTSLLESQLIFAKDETRKY